MARRAAKSRPIKSRARMASTSFALPGKRKYPINTKGRAINALARVSQHGTPAEKRQVRAAVTKRYPSLRKGK